MSNIGEPSPGEIMRRIDDILHRLENLTTKVEESYVRYEVFKTAVTRLEKVEDRSEWVMRLIVGMVIAAIVGTVVVTTN